MLIEICEIFVTKYIIVSLMGFLMYTILFKVA